MSLNVSYPPNFLTGLMCCSPSISHKIYLPLTRIAKSNRKGLICFKSGNDFWREHSYIDSKNLPSLNSDLCKQRTQESPLVKCLYDRLIVNGFSHFLQKMVTGSLLVLKTV